MQRSETSLRIENFSALFGFSRSFPNLFHFTGFKGAFSIAPAAARVLVRALDEGFVWEGDAFSPDRTVSAL